jgi:hypothetical protein
MLRLRLQLHCWLLPRQVHESRLITSVLKRYSFPDPWDHLE